MDRRTFKRDRALTNQRTCIGQRSTLKFARICKIQRAIVGEVTIKGLINGHVATVHTSSSMKVVYDRLTIGHQHIAIDRPLRHMRLRTKDDGRKVVTQRARASQRASGYVDIAEDDLAIVDYKFGLSVTVDNKLTVTTNNGVRVYRQVAFVDSKVVELGVCCALLVQLTTSNHYRTLAIERARIGERSRSNGRVIEIQLTVCTVRQCGVRRLVDRECAVISARSGRDRIGRDRTIVRYIISNNRRLLNRTISANCDVGMIRTKRTLTINYTTGDVHVNEVEQAFVLSNHVVLISSIDRQMLALDGRRCVSLKQTTRCRHVRNIHRLVRRLMKLATCQVDRRLHVHRARVVYVTVLGNRDRVRAFNC